MRIKEQGRELIGQRLRQLRMLRSLSMEELSAAVSGLVTKQAISKYEKGVMLPTSTVLIAFAKALDVRPEYFFRKECANIGNLAFSTERPAAVSAREYNAVQAAVKDAMERYLEIESIMMAGTGTCPPVPLTLKMPESLRGTRESAAWLRNLWHLGKQPIANVPALLEDHGIKVLDMALPEAMDSMSARVGKKDLFVIVNTRIGTAEEKRFALLRETARLLYASPQDGRYPVTEAAGMAEAFSEEMLLPSEILEQTFKPGESIAYQELKQLQGRYGLAAERIAARLKELGIVCKYRYSQFLEQVKKEGGPAKDIDGSCFFESPSARFRTLVHAALAREVISLGKASELLDESPAEIERGLYVL